MPGRRAALALAAGLLAAAACRSVPPTQPLSPQWESLVGEVRPFSALYRLTCCGERGLPTVVRGGDHTLSVAVAVPPGGVAWEAWLEHDEAWMYRSGRACRRRLPAGEVPVGKDARVPLAPDLAGYLLGGRLPPGTAVSSGDPTTVTAAVGPWHVRAHVVGVPPRWLSAAVVGPGAGGKPITFSFADRHGRLPGRVEIHAGERDVLLELVQWLPDGAPTPPAWLGLPECPREGDTP